MLIQCPPFVSDFFAHAGHIVKQFALAAKKHLNTYNLPFVCVAFLHSWSAAQKANIKTCFMRRM